MTILLIMVNNIIRLEAVLKKNNNNNIQKHWLADCTPAPPTGLQQDDVDWREQENT